MIDADDALSLIENNKMENPNNVQIVAFANDGILIDDTKDFAEKGEDIKTTEYFLDVGEEHMEEENVDEQFVTIENSCKDGEEQFITVGIEDTAGAILDDKEVILWNELCRICANGSDRFIPIFTDEGLEHELSNKIHTYLPLEVSETDTLPHQLCYNCAATLLAWHEMIKGCLDAQQRLEEMHNKFQLKDQYYNDSANEEENIQAVSEIEMTNNEEANDQNKEVQNMETVQIVEATDSDRLKGVQQTCSSFKEFKKKFQHTLPAIKNRKKSQTQTKSMKNKVSRTIKKKPKTELDKINEESTLILKEEFIEDSKSSIFNEIKSESATVDSNDNENNATENAAADLPESPKSKKSEGSKLKKVRRKRTEPGLECNQCNKQFRQYNSYQVHMRTHTGEKPYTCHICGKQFGQGGSLYYHLKHVHGGVKNHACDICGRCFAMKTAMEDHRRIHTGERPYVCDSCGKTFKTKASLYIHSKIHTNEYPFKCSYCKKLFRWKQQMISHLTTHTGEKNHICDICGKGFGVKNELTRHRRTHSVDKPFTCQKCGVSFGQKRYLTNHNRTRHKTKVSTVQ